MDGLCKIFEENILTRLTRTIPKIELIYLIWQFLAIMKRYDLLYYDLCANILLIKPLIRVLQNQQNRTTY